MSDNVASASVDLLRQAYQAFNRRDFETVLNMMDSEVDWPNALEGTRLRGHDAVREYWRRQFESLDSTVEPLAFAAETDGRVALKVHQVVHDKAGKLIADQMVEHVYRIRDGLIVSMEIRNPKD